VVFKKALELQLREALAHFEGGGDDGVPVEPLVGVEVEGEAVGLLDILERRSPGVDFEHARLHELQQALEIVDREHVVVADVDGRHGGFVEAGEGMLLEEALLLRSGRAAHQGQRAVDEVRQDPVGDLGVEIGQPLLGDALVFHSTGQGASGEPAEPPAPPQPPSAGPTRGRFPPAACPRAAP
jgi:hypothetical protein